MAEVLNDASQKDEFVLPYGAMLLPRWWMTITPHFSMELNEEEEDLILEAKELATMGDDDKSTMRSAASVSAESHRNIEEEHVDEELKDSHYVEKERPAWTGKKLKSPSGRRFPSSPGGGFFSGSARSIGAEDNDSGVNTQETAQSTLAGSASFQSPPPPPPPPPPPRGTSHKPSVHTPSAPLPPPPSAQMAASSQVAASSNEDDFTSDEQFVTTEEEVETETDVEYTDTDGGNDTDASGMPSEDASAKELTRLLKAKMAKLQTLKRALGES